MEILETIIAVLLLIIVVMTLIAYPKESVSYYKACFKSGVKIFNMIKSAVTKDKHVTNTTRNDTT